MSKLYTAFILLFFSISMLAQQSNTKELEKFTELKVYDRIAVTLVKSNENKLVITGDEKDEVEVDFKRGLLKIKMEFDNFLEGDEANATLYYTENLTLIDANENASITSDKTIKGSRAEIKAQEGGKIDLKINFEDIYTKSISGGIVTLTGKANKQEVSVNTGGKLHNKDLDTDETTVVVKAGGRADVKASKKVTAKVKAGGSIYIYGNPEVVDSDKILGGKIEVVK